MQELHAVVLIFLPPKVFGKRNSWFHMHVKNKLIANKCSRKRKLKLRLFVQKGRYGEGQFAS